MNCPYCISYKIQSKLKFISKWYYEYARSHDYKLINIATCSLYKCDKCNNYYFKKEANKITAEML